MPISFARSTVSCRAAAGARVAIVPHGPLLRLPFAALRDEHGRYLVERYTLSSVPSVALLRFTRRTIASTPGAARCCSSPILRAARIPGEPRLPRLPGAIEETRAIARLVPASRTTLLTGAHATEPAVFHAVEHKTVVHFATHAIVRDTDPLSSFLALDTPHGRGATGA